MLSFEVSQVCMRNWESSLNDAADVKIHLEFYVKTRVRRMCRPGYRTRSTQRKKTDVVTEAREMQWRRYNEDKFLVALFAIGQSEVSFKRGHQVVIAVDVFRSRVDEDDGTQVAEFRAPWVAGKWGPVRLVAERRNLGVAACALNGSERGFPNTAVGSDGSANVDGSVPSEDLAYIELDLRPTSLRPFLLDHARPARALMDRWGAARSSVAHTSARSSVLAGAADVAARFFDNCDSVLGLPWQIRHSATHSGCGLLALIEGSCAAWRPADLTSTWKNFWPGEASDLAEQSLIVPLMEAEFRKDCVVFFSTLFPRTQGWAFQTLRDLALRNYRGGAEAGKSGPVVGALPLSVDSMGTSCGRMAASNVASEVEALDMSPSSKLSPGTLSSDSHVACHVVPEGRCESTEINTNPASMLARDVEKALEEEHCEEATKQLKPMPPAAFHSSTSMKSTSSEVRRVFSGKSVSDYRRSLSPFLDGCSDGGNPATATASPAASVSRRQSERALCSDYASRIMFLKRLFLCFGYCGVRYTEVPNAPQKAKPWPYPLAAVLGHGSRVLIRLEDVEASEFVNFLLFGNSREKSLDWKLGPPSPLHRRVAATHLVHMDEITDALIERKLSAAKTMDTVRNLTDGLRKKHLGLNLPIGGVANLSPLGTNHYIDFSGRVIRHEVASRACSRTLAFRRNMPNLFNSVVGGRFASPRAESSSCSSAPTATSPRQQEILGDSKSGMSAGSLHSNRTWHMLPRVQGGHLYLRVDDFGIRTTYAHRSQSGARTCVGGGYQRRNLSDRRHCDVILLEHVRLRQQVETRRSVAGELAFSELVQRCRRPSAVDFVIDRVGGKNSRLIRMRSEPSLTHLQENDISLDDHTWLTAATTGGEDRILARPPSSVALLQLLRQADPVSTELFGTACFKSVDDLYQELRKDCCALAMSGGQLQRIFEAVALRLHFNGCVLMLARERVGALEVQKGGYVSTKLMSGEDWRSAAARALGKHFDLSLLEACDLLGALPKSCRDISEEATKTTPSYPGLASFHRTHLVSVSVSDAGVAVLRARGMLPAPNSNFVSGFKFTTFALVGNGDSGRKLYWRWTAEADVLLSLRFLCMGTATIEEKWARCAFQREGVLDCPPSAGALAKLLQRCGINIAAFGTQGFKTLGQFWVELLNKDSRLEMNCGELRRVVEVTFVKLRYRSCGRRLTTTPNTSQSGIDSQSETLVLVQVCEELPSKKIKNTRKLVSTRKFMDETWEESSWRCLSGDLNLTRKQLNELVCRPSASEEDSPFYAFLEEVEESPSYPRVPSFYLTHLVTYEMRADALMSACGRSLLGLRTERPSQTKHRIGSDGQSLSDFSLRDASEGLCDIVSAGQQVTTWPTMPQGGGTKRIVFEWMLERCDRDDVRGWHLWAEALRHVERHSISSVLIGLEGSAPHMRSPFGTEHDTSGKSANISAVGARKWRAYRSNNALQIPADIGGMHMCITRRLFEKLVSTCELIDLVDPAGDFRRPRGTPLSRRELDMRFLEQELFRRILGSNSVEALLAIDWIKDLMRIWKSPAAVYASMSGDDGG
eukprot:TRINITY_DN15606_c1_g2_i1.p1 TRINITY_DN15606_c1_g2~~TRINITY_DN15606_c1_g2_i1.p1  ORF type:complete len:1559 (-),score=248.16 TRINITY_DN15606_c1_g2_i1:101-4777(-)